MPLSHEAEDPGIKFHLDKRCSWYLFAIYYLDNNTSLPLLKAQFVGPWSRFITSSFMTILENVREWKYIINE